MASRLYHSHRLLAILVVSSAVFTACDPSAGDFFAEQVQQERKSIINGEACDETQLPSAVALLFDGEASLGAFKLPLRTVICTGTLIAPDVILTAAHCLDPGLMLGGMGEVSNQKYYASFQPDLTSMVMGAGATPGQPAPMPEIPADAIEATAWVAHPDFSIEVARTGLGGPINMRDVGLIFLKEPVQDVDPAVVITAEEATQLKTQLEVSIAGWGQITAEKQSPFEPPAPGTVGNKVCATSFINEIGTHEMQIGGDETTSRKCHGDSGGPSYAEVATPWLRKERVVGITSHSYDQTDCAKGGLDTRVDAWLDWIDGQMMEACASKTRAWCEVEGIIPPEYYEPKPEPDIGVIEPDAGPAGAADGGGSDVGLDGGGSGKESAGGGCSISSSTAGDGSPGLLLLLLLLSWVGPYPGARRRREVRCPRQGVAKPKVAATSRSR